MKVIVFYLLMSSLYSFGEIKEEVSVVGGKSILAASFAQAEEIAFKEKASVSLLLQKEKGVVKAMLMWSASELGVVFEASSAEGKMIRKIVQQTADGVNLVNFFYLDDTLLVKSRTVMREPRERPRGQ